MPNWNQIYASLFSAPLPAGETSPGTDNVDFDDFPGVNKAKMQGGNDFADGNDLANVIFGNGGRDYLRGDGGDDTLHGGNGNDAIIGDSIAVGDYTGGVEAGDDSLWGSIGHDVIAGQDGNDTIDGGLGRDLLMGGNGDDYVNGGTSKDFLIGGYGDDDLRGGYNDDCIAGQLGDDVLRGGFGHDVMSGGDGQDTMYGGSHNDTMHGNAGHDYLNTGNGHDVAYGNSGNDVMVGFNGDDTISGDCGDDAVSGDNGNDLLFGDKGQDNLTGGSGNDSIDGGRHNDIIEGGDNRDCLTGGEGDDLIYGDNANPFLPAAGAASDKIDGGSGNDTLFGGEDGDNILGGSGRDLISGGDGGDTIDGDTGNDTIDGDAGADHIRGGYGEDDIYGGAGNDVIDGGEADDFVNGEGGEDCIEGGNGDDHLMGGSANDSLNGGGGEDLLDGGLGNDVLYGGGRSRFMQEEDIFVAREYMPMMRDGNDTLYGDRGQENGGNDILIGGDAEGTTDYLHGGKDADVLISGEATDIMEGGADNDRFVFGHDLDVNGDGDCDDEIDRTKLYHGNDVITDFYVSQGDLIQLHTAMQIDNAYFDGVDLILETGLVSGNESLGEIRIENIANTVSGLAPDPDADLTSDTIIKFITDYDPTNGLGKGFVVFGDECVTLPGCRPDYVDVGWEGELPDVITLRKDLSDDMLGDTTISTTEQIMAMRFIDSDVNVDLQGDHIVFAPDASTPPTVEVTASDEVIEDIDASAQMVSQSGTVSFDDIDSTDTVTITYEVKEAPVWSDGDFANVALDPQDLIDAFFTGVEDADKPGMTPWTWEGTFDLDFLAKDETITFTIDIIATDCDGYSSRVPLEFLITGTNDVPTLTTESNLETFTEDSDAAAQVLFSRVRMDHDDLDYNDTLDITFERTRDAVWDGGDLAMYDMALFDELNSSFSLNDQPTMNAPTPGFINAVFGYLDGPFDLDFLREGETIELDFEVTVTDPHAATDSETITYVIEGTNDQPVVAALSFMLSEDDSSAMVDDPTDEGNTDPFEALVGTPLTESFVVMDDDVNDTHTFEIVGLNLVEGETNVYQTVDEFGNEYGKLTNNGDGTFTFDPEDDFQHLTAEESREVTFQYRARDDSGVGESPMAPSESELSEVQTVTLTVKGEDDVDLEHTDDLEFVTMDQSMWQSGPVTLIEPDLPFLGFDTGEVSLDATIFAGLNLSGNVLEGILEGIEAVAQVFADLGCSIVNFFGGDCDVDVDLPDEINIPGISTEGYFDARMGLQPYFSFNGGEVDAEIPVEVTFSAPRQVEHGDTFDVSSAFSMGSMGEFSTMSPNLNFGLDFVLDIAGELILNLFGVDVPIIPEFDTGDIDGFEGNQGEPGFNIFDVSGEDLNTDIDLGGFGTFTPNFPVINTTSDNPADGNDTVLNSEGQDPLATLELDLDAIAAELIGLLGIPISFGESGSEGLSIDVAGESLNLISFEWSWDLISVNLINTLNVIQEFEMSINDLPLMATLEDGSIINGFNVGDDIEVTLADDSTFDVDVDGDADGLMDFVIDIDMAAVFDNLTRLGLDIDLFVGLLQLSGGITSDFFEDFNVSLFDGIIPSIDGNDDGFLYGETFNLASDIEIADLYNDSFPLEGWNQETTTFDVDVA